MKWKVGMVVLMMVTANLDICTTLVGVGFLKGKEVNPLGVTVPIILKWLTILIVAVTYRIAALARDEQEYSSAFLFEVVASVTGVVMSACWGYWGLSNLFKIVLEVSKRLLLPPVFVVAL